MIKPGDEFGRLVVLPTPPKVVMSGGSRKRKYEVFCDPALGGCGSPPKWVFEANLRRGFTTSCGCLCKEIITTHGMSRSSGKKGLLYTAWCSMKQRCYNVNSTGHQNYEEIDVCQDWLYSFENFQDWALSHGYQKGLILDRYPDGTGNYCPNNCRWATPEQSANNEGHNRLIEIWNEVRTLSRWARDPRSKVTKQVLRWRIEHGWDPEIALITPPQQP